MTKISVLCPLVFMVMMGMFAQQRPDWVNRPSSVFPESRYVCAVGAGNTRTFSENNAKAELTAIFRQSIVGKVHSYEQGSNINGVVQARDEVSVLAEVTSTLDALVGAEIKETWVDKNGTWYAVCVLEKVRGCQTYTALIENILLEANTLIAEVEGTFLAPGAAREVAALADRAETYAAVLSVLGGPDRLREAAVLRIRAQELRRMNVAVTMRVSGDTNGAFTAAFTKAFADEGIAVSGNNRSRYALNANVTIAPEGRSGRYWKARYTIDAALKDMNTGVVLLHFNTSDRESHPASQDSAINRARMIAERVINEKFPAELRKTMEKI